MKAIRLPKLGRLTNSLPTATWEDEKDPRWLLAVFLRSDIGVSREIADEVISELDSAIRDERVSWDWHGNSVSVNAQRGQCRLELRDPESPDIPSAELPYSELKEIVSVWKDYVMTTGTAQAIPLLHTENSP